MMTLFQATLDHVPITVWLILTFIAVGTVYYFFSPIIMAVAAITPNWLKIALGGIAAGIGVYVYGRYQGAKTARELETQRQHGAITTRGKINDAVKKSSDAELDKRADRWMRD